MSGDPSSDRRAPVRLRIVRGDPSDEEIAALTAVLVGLAGPGLVRTRAPEPGPRSGWADLAPRLRAPVHPGPGAWRTSTLHR